MHNEKRLILTNFGIFREVEVHSVSMNVYQ